MPTGIQLPSPNKPCCPQPMSPRAFSLCHRGTFLSIQPAPVPQQSRAPLPSCLRIPAALRGSYRWGLRSTGRVRCSPGEQRCRDGIPGSTNPLSRERRALEGDLLRGGLQGRCHLRAGAARVSLCATSWCCRGRQSALGPFESRVPLIRSTSITRGCCVAVPGGLSPERNGCWGRYMSAAGWPCAQWVPVASTQAQCLADAGRAMLVVELPAGCRGGGSWRGRGGGPSDGPVAGG